MTILSSANAYYHENVEPLLSIEGKNIKNKGEVIEKTEEYSKKLLKMAEKASLTGDEKMYNEKTAQNILALSQKFTKTLVELKTKWENCLTEESKQQELAQKEKQKERESLQQEKINRIKKVDIQHEESIKSQKNAQKMLKIDQESRKNRKKAEDEKRRTVSRLVKETAEKINVHKTTFETNTESGCFVSNVENMKRLNVTNPKLDVAINAMFDLLSNIVSEPSNSTFRILKSENLALKRDLLDVTGGLECLFAMGFKKINLMKDLMDEELTQLCLDNKITQDFFFMREPSLDNPDDWCKWFEDKKAKLTFLESFNKF